MANIKLDNKKRRSKNLTLVKAPIDEDGVEIDSFDNTINKMNEIYDDILFGESYDDI